MAKGQIEMAIPYMSLNYTQTNVTSTKQIRRQKAKQKQKHAPKLSKWINSYI